jgi:hypothetical protein
VRPGGPMVSTAAIDPHEQRDQISAFAQRLKLS